MDRNTSLFSYENSHISDYHGTGLDDLSVFHNDDPKKDAVKARAVLAEVIKVAIRDLNLNKTSKRGIANLADAARFIFGNKTIYLQNSKQPNTFETYAKSLKLDPQAARIAIWDKLTPKRQQQIKFLLKENYNIDLPENFVLKGKKVLK